MNFTDVHCTGTVCQDFPCLSGIFHICAAQEQECSIATTAGIAFVVTFLFNLACGYFLIVASSLPDITHDMTTPLKTLALKSCMLSMDIYQYCALP